jgi:hypothetical protein
VLQHGGVGGDLRQQLVAGVADITGYNYRFGGSAGIALGPKLERAPASRFIRLKNVLKNT